MSQQRTRTSPQVKWLVNELAAVTGELERIDETMARLRAEQKRLQMVRASLRTVADMLAVPDLAAVVPAVRTHGPYGGRGKLRGLLREALKNAYPRALSTQALTQVALKAFELRFATGRELRRFSDGRLGSALRRLVAQGEIERLRVAETGEDLPGIWRWGKSSPTQAKLGGVRQAAASAAGGAEGEPGWP